MTFLARWLAVSWLCLPVPLLAEEFSPAEVVRSVSARGARQVVNEIWDSEEKTKIFLGGVSKADPDWLEAAKAIKPGTDAGASEELNDAIALALLKRPYALLPWLTDIWWNGSAEICVFGYDSELPGGVAEYIEQLEHALSATQEAELRSLRSACLKGIAETRKQLRQVEK